MRVAFLYESSLCPLSKTKSSSTIVSSGLFASPATIEVISITSETPRLMASPVLSPFGEFTFETVLPVTSVLLALVRVVFTLARAVIVPLVTFTVNVASVDAAFKDTAVTVAKVTPLDTI